MIRAQTFIRQHRVKTPVDFSNLPQPVASLVRPSAHRSTLPSDRTQSNIGAEPSPVRPIHPDPVAGRFMFADGAPRLDEIERVALAKSEQRGWDGKTRSVDHWRAWLMGQYEIQHALWFSAPTREEIASHIASLERELERLPLSIGSRDDLKMRTSELRKKIDMARAELAEAA